jgi:Domain of unknown function (DUF4157)
MNAKLQTTMLQHETPSAPALAQVVQRSCACGGPAGLTDSCPSCHSKALAGPRVQTKLTVGPANDPYEHEADQMADQVMRMPDPGALEPASEKGPAIQRMCTDCEEEEMQRQADGEEEEDQFGQAKEDSSHAAPVSERQTANIEEIKKGGGPLPESTRAFFEPRFGHDFSNVRVHSDDRAARSAKEIRALAYTTGEHIVFGAGQYSPDTQSGQKLLAHELTHVVQQGGGEQIRRQENGETEQESESGSAIILPDVEVPSGLSLPIPNAPPAGSGSEPTAPDEEATVSRLPSSDSANTASPEQQAISEAPYPTGMSPEQLSSEFGSGQSLDAGVRNSYESRYGHSLAHVRVHTDRRASSLCERFGAEAFTYGNHIAFREEGYDPHSPAGEKILRHELTHVLQSPAGPSTIFRAPSVCFTNCPAAGAPAFTPFASTAVNCYGYARSFPPSGFIAPGEIAGTAQWSAQNTVRANPTASAADLAGILPYFTPAAVRTNTEADIGSQISSDCTLCCTSPRRKIIEVCSDSAIGFARAVDSAGAFVAWLPMVSSSLFWDFHWYRKDDDRSWSHKHGGAPAQRNDESGVSPICNPCNADRNFTTGSVDYNHVVGSWCV